jgi:hypothetical protein
VELEEKLSKMSLYNSELKMAQRPNLGREGRKVKLRANYLKVTQVSFKPSIIGLDDHLLLTRDFR